MKFFKKDYHWTPRNPTVKDFKEMGSLHERLAWLESLRRMDDLGYTRSNQLLGHLIGNPKKGK